MLILYYQRLFLFLTLLKWPSENPLLAIYMDQNTVETKYIPIYRTYIIIQYFKGNSKMGKKITLIDLKIHLTFTNNCFKMYMKFTEIGSDFYL